MVPFGKGMIFMIYKDLCVNYLNFVLQMVVQKPDMF